MKEDLRLDKVKDDIKEKGLSGYEVKVRTTRRRLASYIAPTAVGIRYRGRRHEYHFWKGERRWVRHVTIRNQESGIFY